MKKFYFFLLISVIQIHTGIKAQVVINEYSCSNINSYADNFSNYEDWIELYNTTGTAVNLNGWHLSDNKLNPTKWMFGMVNLPAHSIIRVWASGRNINTGTSLHTNFKLTQCKPEAIVLANPLGGIIDSLTLKRTQAGHSRGRTTDGAATWSLFITPTPNASNSNPFTDYAPRPVMSVAPGFYSSAQSVTITAPGTGITIRYTTNGSTPTATSTLYSGPVSISATTVLRARAFSSDPTVPPSFVESNTYFINSPHTVEVVSIFGDQVLTLLNGTQSDPETGMEYFDHTGTFKCETYGTTNKHGNDSWSYPQRGIDFVTHDQYGYNYTLLDQVFNSKTRTDFQHIIFKAAANDNYPFETPGSSYAWGPSTQLGSVHIRDSYVQTLSQKAGLHMDARTWAPSVMYVNGQYWGVYDTREKVDDADYTDYYYNTPEDSLQMLKTWGGTWSEYGGTQAQSDWNNLKTYITSHSMAVAANYNYVDSLFNLKSLADYVILNSFCVTSDWLNWNTIWWRGLNHNAVHKKWRYDLWDEDATFHHYINYTGVPSTNADANPCDPNSLTDPGGQGQIPILNAMMQSPTFYQYFITRYFDLLNGPMSCTRMIEILDSMVAVIQPEMQQHITRWGANGTFAGWQANYQALRTFIQNRCNTVVQQFDNCWPTTGPFPLKVNVYPPGTGTVDLNSISLNSFVWSGQYPGNINILMKAHPDSAHCFDHWEFQNNTPLPNANASSISFLFTTGDSVVAHFSTNSAPVATANPSVICLNDSSVLSINSGGNVTWSPSTGLSCTNCPNPVAKPTVTTIYTAHITGGCSPGDAPVTVTVSQPGVSHPTVTASFSTICIGDTTTLHSSPATTYQWSPAAGLSCTDCADPVVVPTATTTYTVSVTGGCSVGTGTITITIAPPPVISLGESPVICPNTSVQLNATGATSYIWSPAAGLSCINCGEPIASPDTTTTYTIIGSNGAGSGCKDTITYTVFVTENCPDLYIPTGFSPNGDYNNDVYYIFGEVASLDLVIYDRWGHVVFETKDQSKGWDGTSNGKAVQSGVYGFKLTVMDHKGLITKKTGNITLVR